LTAGDVFENGARAGSVTRTGRPGIWLRSSRRAARSLSDARTLPRNVTGPQPDRHGERPSVTSGWTYRCRDRADQHDRAGHQAAAQHARNSPIGTGMRLSASPLTSDRRRGVGAPAQATRAVFDPPVSSAMISSTMLLKEPHCGHFPMKRQKLVRTAGRRNGYGFWFWA